MKEPSWTIEFAQDDEAAVKAAAEQLTHAVEADFGPANKEAFALLMKEQEGVIGMVRGFSHWDWLYIQQLWVHEDHRSRGLGRELMLAAENLAKSRECLGVYVDTFHPRAKSFYLSLGFQEFGRLPNLPPGSARYFFSKRLWKK